jgi:hypothetical protein
MVFFLLVLLAVAAALQAWWMAHALDGVSHLHYAEPSVTEPDAPFLLVTQLTNSGRRFIPFVLISEELPAVLRVPEHGVRLRDGAAGGRRMESTVFLMPRQRWTRRLPVSLPARGRYVLRGATLSGGDFLGIGENTRYFPQTREVIVLPRRWTDSARLDTLGGFLGDVSGQPLHLRGPGADPRLPRIHRPGAAEDDLLDGERPHGPPDGQKTTITPSTSRSPC